MSELRARLRDNRDLDGAAIERLAIQAVKNAPRDELYIQDLSCALVALLPSSYSSIQRILSAAAPKAVYELHFSIFHTLGSDRDAFNLLEQDGIEYMLGGYLATAKSTACYAAWKAGLVLGEEWLSPRSEVLLIKLMYEARFPAGRLGAINGYRFIVQRRKTFSAAEFKPLRLVAKADRSAEVRSHAEFSLKCLLQMKRAI